MNARQSLLALVYVEFGPVLEILVDDLDRLGVVVAEQHPLPHLECTTVSAADGSIQTHKTHTRTFAGVCERSIVCFCGKQVSDSFEWNSVVV